MFRQSTMGLIVLSALASPSIRADEGRIPVYGAATINQSGSYVVTRDISVGSGTVVTIVSPATNVMLDLGGHTVQTSSTTIPAITTTSVSSVTIRNGQVLGGNYGIQVSGALHLTVESVEIQGTTYSAVNANPINGAEISHCHIHDIGGIGVDLFNFTGQLIPSFDARVSDNLIERTGGSAIFLEGLRSGEVARNRISDWGVTGVSYGLVVQPLQSDTTAGGNLITDNSLTTIVATSVIGIQVRSPRNLIVQNVVRGVNGTGIQILGDENRIERNVVSGNAGSGIQVGSPAAPSAGTRNHFEANQAQGNTGATTCGISFLNGNGHTFRNNIVRGNPTGICGGTLGTNSDLGGNVP